MNCLPTDALVVVGAFLSHPRDYHQLRSTCSRTKADLPQKVHVNLNLFQDCMGRHADPDMLIQLISWAPRGPVDLNTWQFSDGVVLYALKSLSPGSISRFAHPAILFDLMKRLIAIPDSIPAIAALVRSVDSLDLLSKRLDEIVDCIIRSPQNDKCLLTRVVFAGFSMLEPLEPSTLLPLLGSISPELYITLTHLSLVSVNEPDHVGRTLLMEAVVTAPDIALLVIKDKADINSTDIRGNAAVHHLASRADHQRVPELVRELVKAKADPQIPNHYGDSAITLANRRGLNIEF